MNKNIKVYDENMKQIIPSKNKKLIDRKYFYYEYEVKFTCFWQWESFKEYNKDIYDEEQIKREWKYITGENWDAVKNYKPEQLTFNMEVGNE